MEVHLVKYETSDILGNSIYYKFRWKYNIENKISCFCIENVNAKFGGAHHDETCVFTKLMEKNGHGIAAGGLYHQ